MVVTGLRSALSCSGQIRAFDPSRPCARPSPFLRGVAQPGSARALGARRRGFKSRLPDQVHTAKPFRRGFVCWGFFWLRRGYKSGGFWTRRDGPGRSATRSGGYNSRADIGARPSPPDPPVTPSGRSRRRRSTWRHFEAQGTRPGAPSGSHGGSSSSAGAEPWPALAQLRKRRRLLEGGDRAEPDRGGRVDAVEVLAAIAQKRIARGSAGASAGSGPSSAPVSGARGELDSLPVSDGPPVSGLPAPTNLVWRGPIQGAPASDVGRDTSGLQAPVARRPVASRDNPA